MLGTQNVHLPERPRRDPWRVATKTAKKRRLEMDLVERDYKVGDLVLAYYNYAPRGWLKVTKIERDKECNSGERVTAVKQETGESISLDAGWFRKEPILPSDPQQ